MKSRARMLLEKEFVKLQSETLWGVIAEPLNDDNFFVWEAKIQGLKDTMWEGGIFKLYFKFNEMYNCAPPQIVFTTIPFHPNVDISNGKPCVDFLDNIHDWKQNYSVGYILLSLQTLLANPVLENAVNNEAASVYVDNPKVYRQIVLNCVFASKRLDADIPPEVSREDADTPTESTAEERCQKSHQGLPRTNKVSFEDYLSLWKGIATSNPSDTTSNPLTEFLKTDNKLQNAHFELSKDELEQEIRTQLAEHNRLMYGTFTKEGRRQYDMVDHKADRINLLKQVCSPKQSHPAVGSCGKSTAGYINSDRAACLRPEGKKCPRGMLRLDYYDTYNKACKDTLELKGEGKWRHEKDEIYHPKVCCLLDQPIDVKVKESPCTGGTPANKGSGH